MNSKQRRRRRRERGEALLLPHRRAFLHETRISGNAFWGGLDHRLTHASVFALDLTPLKPSGVVVINEAGKLTMINLADEDASLDTEAFKKAMARARAKR